MRIGASNGMIGRAISKGTDITSEWLSKIIDNYPDVRAEWLLTGHGEIFQTKGTENVREQNPNKIPNTSHNKPKVQKTLGNNDDYTHEQPVSIVRDSAGVKPLYKDDQERVVAAWMDAEGIPLIPLDAFAGFCNDNSAPVMEFECEKYVIPSFRGADFLIQVKGSSMYPKYSSGDIVACKHLSLDTFFQWNKVYVVDTEQGVLIKRVRRGPDDDHIALVSENERYDPFVLHRSAIHALAIVIGAIRLE
jgi:phage repressor protein C with HTH and peptisase S24 domain